MSNKNCSSARELRIVDQYVLVGLMIQVVVGLVSEKAHGNKPEACYFSVSDTILIKPTEIHEFETEQRERKKQLHSPVQTQDCLGAQPHPPRVKNQHACRATADTAQNINYNIRRNKSRFFHLPGLPFSLRYPRLSADHHSSAGSLHLLCQRCHQRSVAACTPSPSQKKCNYVIQIL